VCMAVVAVCGSSVAPVWADDIYQPPWLRFQPNTTYQDWTFSTPANPSPPDVNFYNPNGMPQSTITGTGNTWLPNYDQHTGVWRLAGANSSMDLYIPNTPRDNARYKDVQTQITWDPDYQNEPAPLVMVNGIPSAPVFTAPVGIGNWMQSVYQTRLAYNPQSEDIIVTGSYALGQVVVDTQCVPEPSTLVLLTMGAFGLAAFVWRRKQGA
jgi:hypothetical protein